MCKLRKSREVGGLAHAPGAGARAGGWRTRRGLAHAGARAGGWRTQAHAGAAGRQACRYANSGAAASFGETNGAPPIDSRGQTIPSAGSSQRYPCSRAGSHVMLNL